jgi:hypothetical protein
MVIFLLQKIVDKIYGQLQTLTLSDYAVVVFQGLAWRLRETEHQL